MNKCKQTNKKKTKRIHRLLLIDSLNASLGFRQTCSKRISNYSNRSFMKRFIVFV